MTIGSNESLISQVRNIQRQSGKTVDRTAAQVLQIIGMQSQRRVTLQQAAVGDMQAVETQTVRHQRSVLGDIFRRIQVYLCGARFTVMGKRVCRHGQVIFCRMGAVQTYRFGLQSDIFPALHLSIRGRRDTLAFNGQRICRIDLTAKINMTCGGNIQQFPLHYTTVGYATPLNTGGITRAPLTAVTQRITVNIKLFSGSDPSLRGNTIPSGQRNISSGINLRRTLLSNITGSKRNIPARSKRTALLLQFSLRSQLQVFITYQRAISQSDITLTVDG